MSLSGRNYEEKRNFIRMKVNTPVELIVENSAQPAIEGICRNLSGGGMLVEAPAVLPIGTKLCVSIASPHGHNPMLKAHTRVQRIDGRVGSDSGSKGEKGCAIGLVITEMIE